jgi:translation initiation factor 3 subunit C
MPESHTPKSYIRIVAELEEFMNESLAKQKVNPKKMNATQARALNAVKQKIKKTTKEYQTQIDSYREDKDAFMESEEEEVKPAPKVKKVNIEPEAAADFDDEGFATVGKGGRALQYTPESIFKHLRGIMESRGKKNTDRAEQIKVMEKLNEIANTPYQRIRVLLTMVSARFDLGSGTSNAMPLDHWKAAEKELCTLFEVLEANKEYIVIENAEEWEDDEKPPTVQPGEKYIKVPGSVVSYVERLDDELTRSLQSIDPHTPEYIERLQDEGSLYNIVFRGQLYYEHLRKDSDLKIPQDSINRIVMRRLEHVYFKVCIISDLFSNPLLTVISLLRLSRPSKRTAGRRLARRSTLPSAPATRPRMLPTWSTSCAIICSATATASFVPVPCCARFTSLPCITNTTMPAI